MKWLGNLSEKDSEDIINSVSEQWKITKRNFVLQSAEEQVNGKQRCD